MRRGFTLIEILVVVSIIGILTTIGLVTYSVAQAKARDVIRKNDLQTLATALEIYFQKNGRYIEGGGTCQTDTPQFYSQIVPYMRNNLVPSDPKTANRYCYVSVSNGLAFRLFAKLEGCSNTAQDGIIFQDQSECEGAAFNYTVVPEDLALAQAPGDIVPTPPSPPPGASPPAVSPSPSPSPTTIPASTAYKRVFVTTTTYNGDLKTAGSSLGLGTASTGLEGGDKICQARANAPNPPLGGTWKAWLSTSTVHARDRIPDAEYRRLDNVVVANNKTDLLDGTLDNPINRDELNVVVTGTDVWTGAGIWTGTLPNGTPYTHNCGNWESDWSQLYGLVGVTSQVISNWTSAQGITCGYRIKLYCFEQ